MFKEYIINLIQHYRNMGVLICLIFEFLGVPVPGEPIMTFLGFLTQKSDSSLILAIIYAVIGTNIGSLAAYIIGYKYSEKILIIFSNFLHLKRESIDNSKRIFDKYKISLFLFGRYVPGLRHLIPYFSGIDKIKLSIFLTFNFIGSVIWCSSFVILGFIVGDKWHSIESLITHYSIIFLLLIIFVFIVYKFFNKHKLTIYFTTLPLICFIMISQRLIEQNLAVFDGRIYDYIDNFINKDLTLLMKIISYLGSGQFLILISFLSFFILKKHKKYSVYSKYILINLMLTFVINEAFKFIFHRERPDILRLVDATGFSFPSGHSMTGLCFYGLILYLIVINTQVRWKKYVITLLFCVFIFSIGLSRIYLGVHYASDVLAGFSFGLAWLVAYIAIINKSRQGG